jgi:hypothetical protein
MRIPSAFPVSGNSKVSQSNGMNQGLNNTTLSADQFVKTSPVPHFGKRDKRTDVEKYQDQLWKTAKDNGSSSLALPEPPKTFFERMRERSQASAEAREERSVRRGLTAEAKNLGLVPRRPGAEAAATALGLAARGVARAAEGVENQTNNAIDNRTYVRDREKELKAQGIGSADAGYIAKQEALGNDKNAQRRLNNAKRS